MSILVGMTKVLGWFVALIIVIIGGWFVYTNQSSSTMLAGDAGSYGYMCDTGLAFSMTPSTDAASLMITPGEGASFGETTLSFVNGDAGQRFEADGMVFVGAGEGVTLTVGNTTHMCNPVPSTDMAPWNWGDAGEGGSIKPDTSLVVTESIQGKWQSTDDAKFVREFKSDDVVVDYYDGKEVARGLWVAFTKENAPKVVAFPIEDNTVYIQITEKGTQADTLNFKLVKLTPDELQLIYMDRGGALNFTAVR